MHYGKVIYSKEDICVLIEHYVKVEHHVALPHVTHTHMTKYTWEYRRHIRRKGRTNQKWFYLFLFISNIIILKTISIVAYNW